MSEWSETSWGAVCQLKYGKSLRNYRQGDGKTRVYGTNGPVGWTTTEPLAKGPRPIVGRKGAYRGIQLAQEAFWVIDTAYWLEPESDLDAVWAYYKLLTVDINGMDSGSAIPSLSREHFEALPLSLPPFDEQLRIASVLGAFDDLIETNRRLGEGLAAEQTADFLIAWDKSKTRLGDIARITMGQSPPGSSYNEDGTGTAFYQGIRDFGWRFPTNRVWTTEPKRMAEQGDVLVAVRAPVGETNIATEATALGRGLAGVRAEGRQATLHQSLTAMPSIWNIHQGTGTVFASINKQGMNALEVPWVDDDALERRLTASDRAIAALHEEIADLTRTRDELLPLLMSGKVRVEDVEIPKGAA